MSDQLRIASALRKLDDAALERVIQLRMLNSSHFRDFFDMADALANQKSVAAALSSLTVNQFEQLEALNKNKVAKPSDIIFDLLLADRANDSAQVFESTLSAIASIRAQRKTLKAVEAAASPSLQLSVADVDRDASLAIFDAIQALTELIFELEQRFIREVGKRGVGLPDIKRLANHLNKSNDYAKQIFELALFVNLAEVEGSRWQLGQQAENWISWTDRQRWSYLSDCWLALLGEEAASELLNLAAAAIFGEKLIEVYPFADSTATNRIKKVAEMANLIGLVANGQATSWLALLAGNSSQAASERAVSGLPAADERLIIQADLTLIAPSPLPTELEIQLRRFVDTEQIGMASSYRLSALSVSHGLETGLTIENIRALLLRLSGKDLPQPVDYLLKEAETRFSRLKIFATKSGAHSQIVSSDSILLAEIHNDQRLKPFALHFDEAGNLHSRFEPELVYFALRDANFVAVRVDEAGKVLSPQKLSTVKRESEQKQNIAEDIARMREADNQGASNPDDDELLRQIQLAIKYKAKMQIVLTTASGELVEYLVEPVGVANGRLRAKDRKADLERTLPLSSVVSIAIQ
ncbi:MAG: hypothetical protein RIR24_608 [Actinomycetota bacterium]